MLSWAIRMLGQYARRHYLNRDRARLIEDAFPTFCFQPFAEHRDLAGLSEFLSLASRFSSPLNIILSGAKPEIYNLIDDNPGSQHRLVFDLRIVSRGIGESGSKVQTFSVFLINLLDDDLTPFSLGREGLANMTLWGVDPDIDFEGEFVFSQNYYLTGADREAVKRLFDSSVVGFFRANTGLFTNGALEVSRNAILFQYARVMSPEDIATTLDTLSKLIELLIERQQPE